MAQHRPYLELAMAQAEQAAREGTWPIGAVLVGADGQVISAGRNRVYARGDTTAHAEVDALRQASRALLDTPLHNGCTLYTTVEPCLMCTGALLMAHVPRVVWAMDDEVSGAVRRLAGRADLDRGLAGLQYVAAPLDDLDRRQREMMAAWDTGRGLDGARWLRTGSSES